MVTTTTATSSLTRPGAVDGQGIDAGVPAHYGDPMGEQRRLLGADALVDLSHRGLVRVTGPDRLTWLHSMTTQKLDDLAPHHGVETLVLSPHGHVEHAIHVVDDGESAWLGVEPGTADALVQWLTSMQFMLRVQVTDVSADFAQFGQVCDEAGSAEQYAADGTLVWVDPWPTMGPDTASYSGDGPHPATGRRWREVIVPRDRAADFIGDRPLSGMLAAEALRVADWRPRLGADTDHRSIPHELDWLRTAVHLHKGCYRGQETVARVHNLGRPPRRVVFLHLDGSGHLLPEPGAQLRVPGVERPVGVITTVARHHEDGPIALAVVKRSTPTDVDLVADDCAAAQTVIVTP
ncbi:folate-binding protein YgfZ [Allobranchiibius sp. GilTou73]|uniref:CAF17-like 4Fe-4S cluster assembly/insertion protein YgfZ n=1 Tax=Allobranchiibius sp. GilTou73 TaxID=2904523 RepID=UPI001F38B5B2|nr:folate-binding protein [Allobranchiibius sp. GilTou73]UIJ35968.1 folate-binding protein [Allobranchiibius sp. GilTou73]